MFLIERRLQILRYLERHEMGTVRQLARLFSVSLETIRSDLRNLADDGTVVRCHGGAMINRRHHMVKLISEQKTSFEVLLI